MRTIRTQFPFWLCILLDLLVLANSNATNKTIATVTVNSTYNLPAGTPLLCEVEPELSAANSALLIRSQANAQTQPAQIYQQGNNTFLCWVTATPLQPDKTHSFTLEMGTNQVNPLVFVNMDSTGLEIGFAKNKALRYEYQPMAPPVYTDSLYTRSAFIHPVWTPNGVPLTRIHASDHMHHMGFWHPWTKTEFEGRHVDFWNIGDGQGTVRFVNFDKLLTGPVVAGFSSKHAYIDLTAPEGEKVALNETWNVNVWAPINKHQARWMWDIAIVQTCATSSPLTILKYRYGGFGFRATADWHDRNSTILTSEGKTRKDGNGERARWCLVQGATDKGEAGILFLGHPDNFNFPEPVRIWPESSRDVYFGFCPVVDRSWTLKPGNNYTRHYRIVAFDGSMDADTAEQLWKIFANPPAVSIQWH